MDASSPIFCKIPLFFTKNKTGWNKERPGWNKERPLPMQIQGEVRTKISKAFKPFYSNSAEKNRKYTDNQKNRCTENQGQPSGYRRHGNHKRCHADNGEHPRHNTAEGSRTLFNHCHFCCPSEIRKTKVKKQPCQRNIETIQKRGHKQGSQTAKSHPVNPVSKTELIKCCPPKKMEP